MSTSTSDLTTQPSLLPPAVQSPISKQESITRAQTAQVYAALEQVHLEMHRLMVLSLVGFSVMTGLLFVLALLFGIFVGHLL